MPLACDCFGGCWGVHSRDWPSIPFSEAAWRRCTAELPYGSYVHTYKDIEGSEATWNRWVGKPTRENDLIRLEKPEYVDLLSVRTEPLDPPAVP